MSRKSGKGIDKRRRYMSYADKVFIDMCRDIIDNGTSTEGEKVRPVWEDGTSAYTIKRFGVVNRYDLSKEFPALTLRRTAIKSCVDELLWIWQKKSNNVNELKSHIWDSWADETGSIGKACSEGDKCINLHIFSTISKEDGFRCPFIILYILDRSKLQYWARA